MMDECYQIWAQLEQEAGTQLHRWEWGRNFLNHGAWHLKMLLVVSEGAAPRTLEMQWRDTEGT